MAAPADIFNSRTNNKTPLTLPETLRAAQEAVLWATNAAQCAQEAVAALEAIEGPLSDRIEANRARSERVRRNGHSDGSHNGHVADIALWPSSHGLDPICRRCGKRVVA
jgi:hypothetical protein